MAFARKHRSNDLDPFTDLLFNALLIFTFLFLVTVVFLNPPAKTGTVDLKAEYMVTVKWPDNVPDDVDTWVEDPDGRIVWFRNAEEGFMHLDRDDRGLANDVMEVDGQEIVNPVNQEVVTIRQIITGEYVVNLHYYKSNTQKPVTVEVSLSKVNPSLEILYYGKVVLDAAGDERTAVRFHMNHDGSVENISTLHKSLVSVEAR